MVRLIFSHNQNKTESDLNGSLSVTQILYSVLDREEKKNAGELTPLIALSDPEFHTPVPGGKNARRPCRMSLSPSPHPSV